MTHSDSSAVWAVGAHKAQTDALTERAHRDDHEM
jgi:hypothetical protein